MFVLAGVVGAIVATPIAVYAAHTFQDVPSSNTFHEDIAWLAGAGVTKGCNPPENTEYCPKDEVTREQMAAFMRRLAQYVGAEDGTPAQADNADTLDGMDSTEFLSSNALRTSVETLSVFNGGSSVEFVSNAAVAIVETTVNVPAGGGSLLVSGHASFTDNDGAITTFWVALDDSSCDLAGMSDISPEPVHEVPGAIAFVSQADPYDDAVGLAGASNVTAGNHTLTLCGFNNVANGHVSHASLVAQFIEDANISVASG